MDTNYPLRTQTSQGHQKQAALQAIITEVSKQLYEDVIRAHADLRAREKRAEKDRVLHGS